MVNLGRKHPFVSPSPHTPISPHSLDANSCHLVTDPAIVIEVRLMTIFTNKFSLTPLPIGL
jgi:hypothetical protein